MFALTTTTCPDNIKKKRLQAKDTIRSMRIEFPSVSLDDLQALKRANICSFRNVAAFALSVLKTEPPIPPISVSSTFLTPLGVSTHGSCSIATMLVEHTREIMETANTLSVYDGLWLVSIF